MALQIVWSRLAIANQIAVQFAMSMKSVVDKSSFVLNVKLWPKSLISIDCSMKVNDFGIFYLVHAFY